MLETPNAMAQTSLQNYFGMSQSFGNVATNSKEEVGECRVEEHEDDDMHWSLDETEDLDDVPSFSDDHSVGLSNNGRVHHGLQQYEQALHCTMEALQFYWGDDTQYLASLFFNVGLLESLVVSTGKTANTFNLVPTESALQQSLKILMRNAGTIMKPSKCNAWLSENTIHRNLLIGQTVWLLEEAQRNHSEEVEGESMGLLQNVLSAWCYPSYQPHSATFQSLQSLSTLYMKKGDVNFACCFLLEALRMRQPDQYCCCWGEERSSSVTDDTTSLELWAQLGECHQLAGRNVEALSCFKQALVILKQSSDSLLVSKSSDKQAIVASVLFNIGLVHASSDKKTSRQRQKALHSFAVCLDVRRASLGHNHPTVATVLYNMAMIMKEDGQVHNAVQLLQESLAIRRKWPKLDCSVVAPSLLAMATIHEERGENLQALLMYQELLALLQASSIIEANTTSLALFGETLHGVSMATRTMTTTTPPILSEEDVWIRLGRVQHALGRMDGAKECYEKATHILRCQLQTEEEEEADTSNDHSMPLSRRHLQQRSAMIEVLRDLGYMQLDRADRKSAYAYFEELSSLSNEALPWSDFNRSFSSAAAA
jgi:tetratricopeptide (TPR) repeat protein